MRTKHLKSECGQVRTDLGARSMASEDVNGTAGELYQNEAVVGEGVS